MNSEDLKEDLSPQLFKPSPLSNSIDSAFTFQWYSCLIKGEMCHFCVTSVSKVSLVSVSRTHLPVWSDELKPLVEPLLLFLLAGLHDSFSVSGTKTNANKWCLQVHFLSFLDCGNSMSHDSGTCQPVQKVNG